MHLEEGLAALLSDAAPAMVGSMVACSNVVQLAPGGYLGSSFFSLKLVIACGTIMLSQRDQLPVSIVAVVGIRLCSRS